MYYFDGERGADFADCPGCNPAGPRKIGTPISELCEEIWSSVWINNPLQVAQWEEVRRGFGSLTLLIAILRRRKDA